MLLEADPAVLPVAALPESAFPAEAALVFPAALPAFEASELPALLELPAVAALPALPFAFAELPPAALFAPTIR